MVKIISQGLLPRDHPMFMGGLETFSSPTSISSFTTFQRPRRAIHPANAPETEEDGIRAEGLRRLRVRHMAHQALRDQTKA
jgi:hypothetical protein